jgi:hypothetical protein
MACVWDGNGRAVVTATLLQRRLPIDRRPVVVSLVAKAYLDDRKHTPSTVLRMRALRWHPPAWSAQRLV